jgi:hypothetical protein
MSRSSTIKVKCRTILSRAGLTAGSLALGASITQGTARAGAGGDTGAAAGPAVPRTRLTDAVERLLRSSSPTFLVQHCQRSLQLAMLIAPAQGLEVDAEVLFVGVMLHDLGLTPAFHAPDVRFEVASANAAWALAREHGMSRRRADNVWDVAALHGTGGISRFKSPEAAVGAAGIGADVTGLGLEGFDQAEIDRIMATRPGFARPFIDAIVTDLRDKPQVASSTWTTTIASDHIPGFHQASIEQLALACPFEGPT